MSTLTVKMPKQNLTNLFIPPNSTLQAVRSKPTPGQPLKTSQDIAYTAINQGSNNPQKPSHHTRDFHRRTTISEFSEPSSEKYEHGRRRLMGHSSLSATKGENQAFMPPFF